LSDGCVKILGINVRRWAGHVMIVDPVDPPVDHWIGGGLWELQQFARNFMDWQDHGHIQWKENFLFMVLVKSKHVNYCCVSIKFFMDC